MASWQLTLDVALCVWAVCAFLCEVGCVRAQPFGHNFHCFPVRQDHGSVQQREMQISANGASGTGPTNNFVTLKVENPELLKRLEMWQSALQKVFLRVQTQHHAPTGKPGYT